MTDDLTDPAIEAEEATPERPEGPCKLVDGVYVALEGDELADFLARENAPPPPPPPRAILIGWFKAALSQMGKLTIVDQAVQGLPEWKRILWEYATSVREDDADVVAVAGALNIDLAAVFDLAEEIRIATKGGA